MSCAILPLAVEAARPRPLDVKVEEVPRIVPDSGYGVRAQWTGQMKAAVPAARIPGTKPSISEVVSRPADAKRGRLPRKSSGNPYGALAQLVVRYIRIVEVRGSTPLCSTRKPCSSSSARFFCAHYLLTRACRSCTSVFGKFSRVFFCPARPRNQPSIKIANFLVRAETGPLWGRFRFLTGLHC